VKDSTDITLHVNTQCRQINSFGVLQQAVPVDIITLYGLTDEGELSATNVSREDPRFAFHFLVYKSIGGTRWRSWLRCCFVSRKVAGSIPGGNIGFILPHYALGGSTQPPNTNEQDWYILGGKAGRCVGLTTLPRGSLHLLEPSGSLKVCTGKVLPLLYKAQVPH